MEYKIVHNDEGKRPSFIEVNGKLLNNGQADMITDNLLMKLNYESENSSSLYLEEGKDFHTYKNRVSLQIDFYNNILSPDIYSKSEMEIKFTIGDKNQYTLKLYHGIVRDYLVTSYRNNYGEEEDDYNANWDKEEYLNVNGNVEVYVQALINFLLEKKQIRQSTIVKEGKEIIMQFISENVQQMVNYDFLSSKIVSRLSDELQTEIDKLKSKADYLTMIQSELNEKSNIRRK